MIPSPKSETTRSAGFSGGPAMSITTATISTRRKAAPPPTQPRMEKDGDGTSSESSVEDIPAQPKLPTRLLSTPSLRLRDRSLSSPANPSLSNSRKRPLGLGIHGVPGELPTPKRMKRTTLQFSTSESTTEQATSNIAEVEEEDQNALEARAAMEQMVSNRKRTTRVQSEAATSLAPSEDAIAEPKSVNGLQPIRTNKAIFAKQSGQTTGSNTGSDERATSKVSQNRTTQLTTPDSDDMSRGGSRENRLANAKLESQNAIPIAAVPLFPAHKDGEAASGNSKGMSVVSSIESQKGNAATPNTRTTRSMAKAVGSSQASAGKIPEKEIQMVGGEKSDEEEEEQDDDGEVNSEDDQDDEDEEVDGEEAGDGQSGGDDSEDEEFDDEEAEANPSEGGDTEDEEDEDGEAGDAQIEQERDGGRKAIKDPQQHRVNFPRKRFRLLKGNPSASRFAQTRQADSREDPDPSQQLLREFDRSVAGFQDGEELADEDGLPSDSGKRKGKGGKGKGKERVIDTDSLFVSQNGSVADDDEFEDIFAGRAPSPDLSSSPRKALRAARDDDQRVVPETPHATGTSASRKRAPPLKDLYDFGTSDDEEDEGPANEGQADETYAVEDSDSEDNFEEDIDMNDVDDIQDHSFGVQRPRVSSRPQPSSQASLAVAHGHPGGSSTPRALQTEISTQLLNKLDRTMAMPGWMGRRKWKDYLRELGPPKSRNSQRSRLSDPRVKKKNSGSILQCLEILGLRLRRASRAQSPQSQGEEEKGIEWCLSKTTGFVDKICGVFGDVRDSDSRVSLNMQKRQAYASDIYTAIIPFIVLILPAVFNLVDGLPRNATPSDGTFTLSTLEYLEQMVSWIQRLERKAASEFRARPERHFSEQNREKRRDNRKGITSILRDLRAEINKARSDLEKQADEPRRLKLLLDEQRRSEKQKEEQEALESKKMQQAAQYAIDYNNQKFRQESDLDRRIRLAFSNSSPIRRPPPVSGRPGQIPVDARPALAPRPAVHSTWSTGDTRWLLEELKRCADEQRLPSPPELKDWAETLRCPVEEVVYHSNLLLKITNSRAGVGSAPRRGG